MRMIPVKWNMRLVRFNDVFEDSYYLALREVYYENDGTLSGHCEFHNTFDTVEDVEMFIAQVKDATKKPVLDETEFPAYSDDGNFDDLPDWEDL